MPPSSSRAKIIVLACYGVVGLTRGFQVAPPPAGIVASCSQQRQQPTELRGSASDSIVSPFDAEGSAPNAGDDYASDSGGGGGTQTATKVEGPLELTLENVEVVLDEMRPYLIQDGGNVAVQEIDGPVVRLQLQGACGTCPSSTQTMKMGLERGLKEKIPEIQEVVQSMPEGPELNEEQVDVILDGVRPFLQVAGGSISLDRFEGLDGLQPAIWLRMEGSSASLNSVKLEIAQRLQRHFMVAGLRVEWVQ